MLVCVIDDEAEIVGPLVKILEAKGHEALSYRNGAEAIAGLKIAKKVPDIIITDLMMPVMDGLEFRKKQIETPRIKNIPTYLFTASARLKNISDSSFSGKLMKPVSISKILELVEHHSQQSKQKYN